MPDWNEVLRDRIASAGLDAASETDVVEELAQHLEDRYGELRSSGLSDEECRCQLMKELDSDAWASCLSSRRITASPSPLGGSPRQAGPFAGFSHNLRIAFRSIRKKPAFSIMVITILALAIGGNAVIFSVFNSLYLRPLPFPESGRLVDLDETAPRWNLQYVGVSAYDLLAWRKNNASFDNMAFFRAASYNFAGGAATSHVQAAMVTHEMLDVLRLAPELGRNFNQQDDEPNAAKVVLISHTLWQSVFQGDRGIAGRVVKIDEEPYTVIGVLPRQAVFPDGADLWIPLAPDPSRNTGYYVSGIGRLKQGVSIGQAQADLSRVHKAMIAEGRTVNEVTSPVIAPLRDRYLGGLKSATKLLLVGVALVLLIACVDISALLLVRGASRSQEIAIRMAIGASRGRIVTQLFTENLVLAFTGALLGTLLGEAGLQIALARASDKLPHWITFSLDWRFILFCLLITCCATVVFGLVPTLQCARVDIRSSLGDGSTHASSSRGRRITLSTMVVFQIAFALVLSIGAGLLFAAFRKVLEIDPGFRPENVLLFRTSLPQHAYGQPDQKIRFYDSVLARLAVAPGVTAVAATSAPPLGGHWGGIYEADKGPDLDSSTEKPNVLQIAVTPDYLSAFGMPLLAGRNFTPQDNQPDAPMVVMVNETFARHYWGTGNPIGHRVRRPGAIDSKGLFNTWFQVIGLVRDERHDGLDQKPTPTVFLPLANVVLAADSNDARALEQMTFAIRASGNPESFAGMARDVVHQLAPKIPVFLVQTLQGQLDDSLWARRICSSLFEGFAFVAVFLAMAGIYGVMSYSVSQRLQEFGIRIALGATRPDLLRIVLAHSAAVVFLGTLVGLVNALWATSLLRSLLFGVASHDLLIYFCCVLGVGATGVMASIGPALRAARVSPVRALRSE